MTSREFAYWLQGFFEIAGPDAHLSPAQVEMVRAHLNMVFIHEIDPSYPSDQQQLLNEAHTSIVPLPPQLDLQPFNHFGGPALRC